MPSTLSLIQNQKKNNQDSLLPPPRVDQYKIQLEFTGPPTTYVPKFTPFSDLDSSSERDYTKADQLWDKRNQLIQKMHQQIDKLTKKLKNYNSDTKKWKKTSQQIIKLIPEDSSIFEGWTESALPESLLDQLLETQQFAFLTKYASHLQFPVESVCKILWYGMHYCDDMEQFFQLFQELIFKKEQAPMHAHLTKKALRTYFSDLKEVELLLKSLCVRWSVNEYAIHWFSCIVDTFTLEIVTSESCLECLRLIQKYLREIAPFYKRLGTGFGSIDLISHHRDLPSSNSQLQYEVHHMQ